MAGLGITELVAVAVIVHITVHVGVVVVYVNRPRMPVAGRIISPVPGRTPGLVVWPQKVGVDDGPDHENGLDDIGRPVDVGRSDDLDVAGCGHVGDLGDEGGYVLIYVGSQDRLDHEHVRSSLNCLDNPQIIDISVLIEVEVG